MVGKPAQYRKLWLHADVVNFEKLSSHIEKMCQNKNIVLMIDEVDKTTNSRVFLQLLGMLHAKFLNRQDDIGVIFHRVILVGVYDIKNIKLKMINDGIYVPHETENHTRTSPWNIAATFKVDMSFNPDDYFDMALCLEKFAEFFNREIFPTKEKTL